MLKTAKLGLALLLAALAGAAQAVTGLAFVSTVGDYIGQGQSQTYRAPQAVVSGHGTASQVTVSASDPSGSWTMEFAAPSGSPLVAASYPAAARYPIDSPLVAGMDFSNSWRACNQIKGWFRVIEYAVDAAGAVSRLAIDFMQNCEITMPPLYGSVRINSRHPLAVPSLQAIAGVDFAVFAGQTAMLDGTQSFSRQRGRSTYQWTQLDGPAVVLSGATSLSPTFLAPSVGSEGAALRFRLDVSDAAGRASSSDDVVVLVKSPSGPTTLVGFHGDSGDYITLGRSYSFDPSNAVISFSRNSANGVTAWVNLPTGWVINAAAANGGPFTTGTYRRAQDFPSQEPNRPGFSLSGEGRGCSSSTGQFTVHRVQFDSGGMPQVLDLSFEQHCGGDVPGAYGQVLLNVTPHTALAPQLRAARQRYGVRE